MRFKRYCKTLKLQNDPDLIARYKEAHAMGKVWPEVLQEMKKSGYSGYGNLYSWEYAVHDHGSGGRF
jgi:L-rhamnose mutarotase